MAVFCGSKTGNDPLFIQHAQQLGYLLAEKGIDAIYGGSSKGLMGAVANAAMERNGKVIGIIPSFFTQWEHQHTTITELIVVDDMHTRKKLLYERCDAAIILPGGVGTLDEFFEMLTWNQLSIHNKKIFLLNTNGFYNFLLNHLKKMQEENFLHEKIDSRITILENPELLPDYLF
ncbi:LOG family protein [Ferruginibacter albus]|uniref:LOG family protein n=1 Tax=Ferruginibacter albus TaxID=2875540 RepID=UPI002106EB31|nr:TIGR00730 family Rossman fold protein [Ferruginibacter albus]